MADIDLNIWGFIAHWAPFEIALWTSCHVLKFETLSHQIYIDNFFETHNVSNAINEGFRKNIACILGASLVRYTKELLIIQKVCFQLQKTHLLP